MNRGPESDSSVATPAADPVRAGRAGRILTGFLWLIWLTARRQARAGQTVGIALLLLGTTAGITGLISVAGGWGKDAWRAPRRTGPTYREILDSWTAQTQALAAHDPVAYGVGSAVTGAHRAALGQTGFSLFSSWMVFSIFLSFLLPVWCMTFAVEPLGGERESGSLLWLLTRPIPRPLVYLGQFLGGLPWCLGFALGGFAVLCAAAGPPGWQALTTYWPAVLAGATAFAALFHLMAACFQRPAVLAIVYTFFLEILLGNMPGYLKRVSISFYTRCLMFAEAGDQGLMAVKPSVYLAVDGTTAGWVLVGATAGLLTLGMVVFARREYV